MRHRMIAFLVIGFVLLSVVPVMADTEEEMIAKFFNKTNQPAAKKVGFLVVNGSLGRLNKDNDYNKFTNRVSPLLLNLSGGSTELEKVFYSHELYIGAGMMTSPNSAMSLGFSYWLKMGSNQVGDFNLSQLNASDPDDHYSFDLKSELQVYGIVGNLDYYLLNPPDRDGILRRLSVRTTVGGGYYFARWELWEGFTGYNLSTEMPEVVEGKLTGQAPGFSGGVAVEFPVRLGGLVAEGTVRYLYLNFNAMKWYNSNSDETVATVNNSGTRVDLDFSGPRVHFGLKRYFGW
jgi:hypothetical protein